MGFFVEFEQINVSWDVFQEAQSMNFQSKQQNLLDLYTYYRKKK